MSREEPDPNREALESEDCPQPYDDTASTVRTWEARLDGKVHDLEDGTTCMTIRNPEAESEWLSSRLFCKELARMA